MNSEHATAERATAEHVTTEPPSYTASEVFERGLRENDPRIRVVAPRIVRRVIRHCHEGAGIGFQIPTRQAYVASRDRVLAHVAARELSSPPEPESALPEQVILVGRPDADELDILTEDELQLRIWRLLFEARVEAVLRMQSLGVADIRERLATLGQAETDEIRSVLRQERRLLPPGDDIRLYEAFVPFYLELRWFEPAALSRFFPSLSSLDAVDALVARDITAKPLIAEARPSGASDAVAALLHESMTDGDYDDIPRRQPVVYEPSATQFDALVAEGEAASVEGNAARACLQLSLALKYAASDADDTRVASVHERADAELSSLSTRLAAVFADTLSASRWKQALTPLVAPGIDGRWSQEARLLYDLQKLCVEHERARFKLDLPGWIATLGRRSLKRPLPNQQLVLQVKHLRSARDRTGGAHISAHERARLRALLGKAEQHHERVLRERLRPGLVATLDKVGLAPSHLPEEVALDKLIDELLDRAVKTGFLAIGDLRDALSRNNLKLRDLRFRELVGSDALLAADRELARNLRGVYRPGEVYLRGLQRGSALAFGTKLGRWLTRYLALPFGGAFVILEGVQHIVGPLLGLFGVLLPKLANPLSLVGLGVFLIGILYWRQFRSAVWWSIRAFGRSVRAVVYTAPHWLLTRPLLRRLVASRPVQLCWHYLIKPGLVSALLSVALALGGVEVRLRYLLVIAGAAFLGCNLALNSRLGRDVQEICIDGLARGWLRLRQQIVPGLIRFVLDMFKRMLGGFERVMYTVDEWLRFKQGESALALAFKSVLSMVWGAITYIVRIYITLLVEPQVNPIKHFPVVTVSHKIILPFSLQITAVFATPLTPLFGSVVGNTIAGATVFLLPGVFGFLVWELKENWKLYDASRGQALKPTLIGSHGETMGRFLRPGFHSGTLPKLYSKLRRAERRARRRGRWRKSQKLRAELHHVEHDVAAFVEREFVALLTRAPHWGGAPLSVAEVSAGSNRIRVGLRRYADEPPMFVTFEEQSNLLVAGVTSPGFSSELDEQQRNALRNALVGMYKLAGVYVCREQVETLLPDGCAYDVQDEGLTVWPTRDFRVEAIYPIHNSKRNAQLTPRVRIESDDSKPDLQIDMPVLVASSLRFDTDSVSWANWIDAWHDATPPRLLPSIRVLPPIGAQ